MQIVFWLSLFLVFYTYIGYALLLLLLPKKKRSSSPPDVYPPLTLVVPVYNEEQIIGKKIENCYSLAYNGEIQLLLVNDGSTDNTAEIVRKHPRLRLIENETRQGKTAALNAAMKAVTTPLVVFTDANAMLDHECLHHLVRHYSDDAVGGVSGEKKISENSEGSAVTGAEQLYWKYESFLKKMDSGFYSVVGADGGLYSIRSHLFQSVKPSVILDDFFISVGVCEQGYQFVYEPRAFAIETASISIREEQKRKVRISAGCFQALFLLKGLLNPFRNAPLSLIYLSHRVLRWVVCPLLLPLILISNACLAYAAHLLLYDLLFFLQVLFYVAAITGWVLPATRGLKLFLIPYYFVFMNLSLCQGFYRYIRRQQPVAWAKTERRPF